MSLINTYKFGLRVIYIDYNFLKFDCRPAHQASTPNNIECTRQVCQMKLSVLGEYTQLNLAYFPRVHSSQGINTYINYHRVLAMKLSILGEYAGHIWKYSGSMLGVIWQSTSIDKISLVIP